MNLLRVKSDESEDPGSLGRTNPANPANPANPSNRTHSPVQLTIRTRSYDPSEVNNDTVSGHVIT